MTMETIIKQYDNGLRLVVQNMPNYQSVAFSVMVMVGSGDELPDEHGLSHFCEHMLFKGTKRRTGQQIIDELSMLGVDYNAWTSEAATCYHTKGIADNLPQCVDILSDMYFNLNFEPADFAKEGDVIVQEIAMHEDRPTSVLYDQLNSHFFGGTKYEHTVLGTAQEIKNYQPEAIYRYIKKHYIAPNTIIALAGNVTLAQAEALVQKYFLPYYPTTKAESKLRPAVAPITPVAQQVKKKKDTEQQHVALVFPVCNQFSDDRYALELLSLIFGGDMSSRLFINVREKLGLVYSIHSDIELCDIGGYFAIAFSCTPKNTTKVIEVVSREINLLLEQGVTAAELDKARNFRRTKKLFESESTLAVNSNNADELAMYGQIQTTQDYLAHLAAVDVPGLNAVIHRYFDLSKMSTFIVGK